MGRQQVFDVATELVALHVVGVLDRDFPEAAEEVLEEAFEEGAREGDHFEDLIQDYHAKSPSPFRNTSSRVFLPAMTLATSGLTS